MNIEERAVEGRKGVSEYYREGDTKPFARVLAPKANGSRKWHIHYRQGIAGKRPFDESLVNIPYPTKEGVERELQHAVKHATASQLGLDA